MKASVQDAEALSALRPAELAAYLRATGWHQERLEDDRASTWTREGDFEVLLPLTRGMRDFPTRMGDVLRVLAITEDRSELEILTDLMNATADILRLRVVNTDTADGTISLEDGARFIHEARELMLAGACAAIQPRAVYQTKKFTQATDYLRRVRLGQSERGSYVVTVVSRVAPELTLGRASLFPDLEEPFERKVTLTLAHAVSAVKRAALAATATGDFQEFAAAVEEGVSANLCDAIRGLGGIEEDRGVDIAFSWSRSRALDIRPSDRVLLPADMMPVIGEAARMFRETSTREDFELRGFVTKLERGEGDPTGRATIQGLVDGALRKVILELLDEEYHSAVVAHDEQRVVTCLGILAREGRSFVLRNPHGFDTEPDA